MNEYRGVSKSQPTAYLWDQHTGGYQSEYAIFSTNKRARAFSLVPFLPSFLMVTLAIALCSCFSSWPE